MKKNFLKIAFVAGVILLSIGAKSSFAVTEDPGSGGFTCPSGDKYKCAEKDGWVVYKGDGEVKL